MSKHTVNPAPSSTPRTAPHGVVSSPTHSPKEDGVDPAETTKDTMSTPGVELPAPPPPHLTGPSPLMPTVSSCLISGAVSPPAPGIHTTGSALKTAEEHEPSWAPLLTEHVYLVVPPEEGTLREHTATRTTGSPSVPGPSHSTHGRKDSWT